jgi:membrane protease YdiL (CAAX protease family)
VSGAPKTTFVTILSLLAAAVLWIALEAWLWGLPFALVFAYALTLEPPYRRKRYLALAAPLLVLSFAPIATDTSNQGFLLLGTSFVLVLVLPTLILWREQDRPITFAFWPRRLEPLEILYTLLAVPLAWGAFWLYFGVLSPEVPLNWALPEAPDNAELLRLFIGINLVGIWDELFFINIGYAVLRQLFPARTANLAQAVIYTTVLWTMAFRGVGPLFVYLFALTQGAMYERSRVLLWVLIVHLIVDYFLFQAIVSAYYPDFSVWWH